MLYINKGLIKILPPPALLTVEEKATGVARTKALTLMLIHENYLGGLLAPTVLALFLADVLERAEMVCLNN